MLTTALGLLIAIRVTAASQNLTILRIFHQNDIHSHYDEVLSSLNPCPKNNLDPRQKRVCYGGFARAVAFIKKRKTEEDSMLNVNAGDFFQGHVFYTIFGWKMAADMVSQMPYDALALGNQEFYGGLDGLVPLLRRVNSSFICTNLHFTRLNDSMRRELRQLCPRKREKWMKIAGRKKKLKVGILGYTTPDTEHTAHTGGIWIEDEVKSLTMQVAKLSRRKKGKIKLFVAVGHSGLKRDLEVARQVPSLDVVVGGHSHTLLWPGAWQPFRPDRPEDPFDHAEGVYPQVVTQASGRTVLVVQALKHGKYMGAIDVGLNEDGEVRDWWPENVLLRGDMPKDEGVDKILHQYERQLEENLVEVVGEALVTLDGRRQVCLQYECNFGNLFADAILWANQRREVLNSQRVNIALINSGSFRNRELIQPGNITLKMLLETLPYQNTITTVYITGATLLRVLENSAAGYKRGHFLQVSGIRVVYNVGAEEGNRVRYAQVLCVNCTVPYFAPVRDHLIYAAATTTFMAFGGDGYDMIREEKVSERTKNMLDIDIMMEYLQRFSKVYPRIEGRIKVVNESTVQSTGVSNKFRRRAILVPVLALFVACA